jgi:diguanylate cyclase (GGDEF)-like protein/PAS domain S-box-containing protein
MALETCCFGAASETDLCTQILAKMPASVLLFDIPSASIVYSNQSLMESLGYASRSEVISDILLKQLTHPDDLVHTEEAHDFLSHAHDGEYFDLEQRFKHADGSWRWLAVRLVVFARNAKGTPTQLLGLVADITSSKRLQEQFERDASHDFLTGLLNRRYLIRSLEHALAIEKGPITICLCDIDHFKRVNDTYGHLKGDEVLQYFAAIAQRVLSKKCVIGRLGGDEFCIIIPGVTVDSASACIERIRKHFAGRSFTTEDGTSFSVTASFGLAEWEPKMDWRDFLNSADKALFDAKRRGRNLIS